MKKLKLVMVGNGMAGVRTPGLRPNIAGGRLDPGQRALPRRRLPSTTLTAPVYCPLRRLAKDTA